ncbi:hypothetical protein K490DRAFT_31708 [Saccharata proteae CBS 121410]|uniref:HECT-type E3 ubiquitin transferase n=1 Tax=Saccharata proteae CBS 121410 TaxID=1314787 RepID=A0A9P4M1W3_9PEZI|nr:hypothetical protein K490DRAFT_31708 [Saccharata proteae CBS 121410]
MSSRVTRSSARLTAASSNPNQTPQQPATDASPSATPPTSKKRKAPARETSPEQAQGDQPAPVQRRRTTKRSKADAPDLPDPQPAASSTRRRKGKATSAMSSAGPSGGPSEEKSNLQSTSPPSNRRKSNRRKENQELTHRQCLGSPPATAASAFRRTKKQTLKVEEEDVVMKDDDNVDEQEHTADRGRAGLDDDGHDDAGSSHQFADEDDDDEDDDPFGGAFLSRHGGPAGLAHSLRALSGMMSGTSSRLRGILDRLRQKDDISVQLIALQDLSELLLVSTEDNLAGHFMPDQYVKELVALMQPSDFGEPNEEIMLLACRCLANLMEALPAATANVVYGNAVPVLCQKLIEIQYIDLAEQALSTLEKISVEFPASIVREGGLTACLSYLDFFPTSTQRTAVTTAANCCRNIPEDSFPVVRDVMPILKNVLTSNDQRVVEQGCYCVSRIIESFKFQSDRLEELVSSDLLDAILRLLLPGTTNLIGPAIHTLFLRVLAITARASPRLSVDLFRMKVVDTLYQILTGVSPPDGTEDIATKIDSVVIMQALVHRPREQIFETLNVICELLPNVHMEGLTYLDDLNDAGHTGGGTMASASSSSANDKRLELLDACKDEVRRFGIILLPTLTDAYSSTVNLGVRQKVLTAQLKMLSNLDIDILKDALRSVPYASFLASILSQQDHPSLVTFALQAAELLLKRLESVYRYQFYREGVISEISRLAERPCKSLEDKPEKSKAPKAASGAQPTSANNRTSVDIDVDRDAEEPQIDDSQSDDDEDDQNDDDDDDQDDDEDESSSSDDQRYQAALDRSDEDIITIRAKKFVETHEVEGGLQMRKKASSILTDLRNLAGEIKACYARKSSTGGEDLFGRLAKHFEGDALESITSYELLTSGIVEVLLDLFSGSNAENVEARTAFLEAFMGTNTQNKQKTASTSSPVTAFSILVSKLQDLLSRAEHFEVMTVHQNTFDSNRGSAASMLAKQLRLRLVADEDSGIPSAYRSIMVAIHAIATLKSLDEYLRPRISMEENRPPRQSGRARDGLAGAMAAYAAAKTKSADAAPTNAESSATPDRPSGSRRSSRKQQTQAPPPPPPPAATSSLDNVEDPLECADETQLSDAEDDLDGSAALGSFLDPVEDDMDDEVTEPGAVSVEVASTGKVSAHKEDGTRVATPLGGATPSSARAAQADRSMAERFGSDSLASQFYQRAFGTPARAMSYAAAIQSTPQDWHIEFSVNGQRVSNGTTIYRAVHLSQAQQSDATRNIWSPTHTVKFKKVAGPPPTDTGLTPSPESAVEPSSGIPQSLSKNPTTAIILRLLSILHELNANLDDVMSENKDAIKLNAEPLSQFVNTKLTAKLNRQLEEPLIVASNCLPTWSEDLARLYPFLFPFETRHLFLQSTSFGYSRSMARWQSAQPASDSRHHRDERPFLGRLQRQKVRISRMKILESAIKVMELYGSSPSVLEVEYFEEVGTGLGPTLEFYSTVSKEFSKKKLKLWRENESNDADEFAFGKHGLFPAPMNPDHAETENGKKVLHLFKTLGKFVARSMLDSRIIDVSFNPTFFRIGDAASSIALSLGTVKTVDGDLARSLSILKQFANAKKKVDEDTALSAAAKAKAVQAIEIHGSHVEDLALDFTLPGYSSIEMVPDGANTLVTIDNVGLYIEKVLDFTLARGVQKQAEAFRAGFSQVFPYSALKAFTSDELVMLFGRVEEDWSLETLMDSIKADHGYNLDSKSVRNLLQTMSELQPQQRRDFLQFVTGSPKLPIGGFKSLTPMFTVVCKPSEPPYTSDDYLPSVMTCVNYLKMPDYSSLDVLREKLNLAIREGQGAFHLS